MSSLNRTAALLRSSSFSSSLSRGPSPSPFLRLSAPPIFVGSSTRYCRRPLHISSRRAALSESDHSEHEDADDRKAKIDHHKHDQLNKQKEGKGHWKGELGSNSESAIKADREEILDAEHDIESLQKETSEAMEGDHEHGKK